VAEFIAISDCLYLLPRPFRTFELGVGLGEAVEQVGFEGDLLK
jgi:hypothetical protein